MFSKAVFLASLLSTIVASPSSTLHPRSPNNIVYVTNAEKYCLIVPKDAHTNIGASEYPGGMTTYCSKAGKYDDAQGTIPNGFWKNVDFQSGISSRGARFAQLTGCIRPELVDRLNPNDDGGQYDSSGGDGGRGNPEGSVCLGYSHYVELIEPSGPRACIKCCDNYDDCPLHLDTAGCPSVVPGNYFDCA
ncbi:hypothetical protein AAF712_009630 [Marasmius tenuissimus]|uniref:Effector protein n=1 Tax=Marasmius tenuissimus TaxID=585030 RepID=A0ABR2ZP33_9AGAR